MKNRKCGDCQLCCVLLPVQDGATVMIGDMEIDLGGLNKPANTRCPHQKHGVGCVLHGTKEMPFSCKVWTCRWLINDDTDDMERPDRSHYVIDVMPEVVGLRDNETGREFQQEVIQIWCDPKYPNAWDVGELRAYLQRQRKCALVRFNTHTSRFLAPPSVTGHGWVEKDSEASPEAKANTVNYISQQLGYKMIEGEMSENGMTRVYLERPDGTRIEIATKPNGEEP